MIVNRTAPPLQLRERIPELDGLRAIAILLVIGCHYEKFAALFGGVLQFGWVGVDTFFVLSGYLITNVLLQLKERRGSLKRFYLRRARRILPPYIIAVVAISVTCVALGDTSVISLQWVTKDVFFLQSFGWLPTILQRLAHPSFAIETHIVLPTAPRGLTHTMVSALGVLWSLSIEEYFYLLWAPLVLFCNRRTVWITAIAICVFGFVMRWIGFIGVPSYFTIFHRFDALIYGAIASLVLTSRRPIPKKLFKRTFVWGLVTLSFVIGAIWPVLGLEIRCSQIFILFGLPAISIVAASFIALIVLHSGHRFFGVLRSAPMRFIGRISYMLYLLHAFVYLEFVQFFPVTWLMTIASLSMAIFLCWLSWTYIENPILNSQHNK